MNPLSGAASELAGEQAKRAALVAGYERAAANVTVQLADLRAKVDTLTAQRDRARTWAVTLEQELAKARDDNHEDRVRYIDNTMRTGQDVESLWDLLGQAASALHLYVDGQSWPDQEDARAKAERVLAQVSERAAGLR